MSSRRYGERTPPATAVVATHYVKNVPISPNIPVAEVRYPVPWSALVLFLVVATAIVSGFISFVDWYTINRTVPLTEHTTVLAVLKNCGVTFSQSPTNVSYVTVRSWLNNAERSQKTGQRRLDETPLEWSNDLSTLKIRLALIRDVKYLLCSVHFHLAENFTFKSLQINYAPAQSYVDIESTVPIKATQNISFRVLHAQMSLTSIAAPSIQFNIGDGALRFGLNGNSDDYSSAEGLTAGISIKSRTAPVVIECTQAVALRVPASSASKALIRSVAGDLPSKPTDEMLRMHLSPNTSSLTNYALPVSYITMDIEVDNGALYINVRNEEARKNQIPLNTWAGYEHLEEPHLLDWSSARLQLLKPWLEFEPFSPWVVEIVEHRTSAKGYWRYLSSSAYLRGGNWFVLFSAGLLQPRQQKLQVHVMGIFCRSRDELDLAPIIPDESVDVVDEMMHLPSNATKPLFTNLTSSTINFESEWGGHESLSSHLEKIKRMLAAANSRGDALTTPGRYIGLTDDINQCQQELLADTFLVLWKSLEFSRTESTMVVYRNDDKHDVRFDVRGDAVVQDFITWSDVWFFIVAIAVNIIFAGILACIGTAKLQSFCTEFLLDDFNAKGMLCTASHRLDHEISKSEDNMWSLSVSRVHYPTSGFTIRWNHEPGVPYNRYGVHIRPVDMNWLSPPQPEGFVAPALGEVIRNNQPADIYIYLPLSAAKAAQDVVVHQRQLFLPFKQPGKVRIECSTHYELKPDHKYRFQLQAINAQGRVVDHSVWSPEVRPSAGLMFVDLPLLVLGRFCPVRNSSLDMFIRKHVLKTPLSLTCLRLNYFVLEMFSDVGTVKTTSRRRQFRGTLKYRTPQSAKGNEVPSQGFVRAVHPESRQEPSKNIIVPSQTVSYQLVLSLTSSRAPLTVEDRGSTTIQTMLFYGRPEAIHSSTGSGSGQTVLVLRGGYSQSVRLIQSRITQRILAAELSDGSTGRRLATGYILLEEVHNAARKEGSLGSRSLDIQLPLDHIDSVGQWGRLNFKLFIPGLNRYERSTGFLCDQSLSHEKLHADKPISASTLRQRRPLACGLVPVVTPLGQSPVGSPRGTIEIERYRNVDTGGKATLYRPPLGIAFDMQYSQPSKLIELCTHEVGFVRDIPAAQYLEGTDMTISWIWDMGRSSSSILAETKPDNVFLHLIDHNTGCYLSPLHLGHPIPNTGTYSWTIHAVFDAEQSVRSAYLALTTSPVIPGDPLEVSAASNTFFILKCLPLCELEMCYAAFCRTHRLEMEHLSDSKLLENGIVTYEASVKVCPDLRHPLPFEPFVPCVHCPGQCVPSSVSKLVRLRDTLGTLNMASGLEGPISVYKAVSRKLKVVENCIINRDPYWWFESPDTALLRFDLHYHSVLLNSVRSFLAKHRTTREMLSVLGFGAGIRLGSSGNTFHRYRYLEFKVFPLLIQIFVIWLQLCWFGGVPLLILFGYMEYDRLLANFINQPHQDIDPNYIIDIVFQPSISFIMSLRFPGALVVLMSLTWLLFITIVVLFSPIIRNSYLRLRRASQYAGRFIQSLSAFLTLWLLLMFLLWLVLGALINSEGFLPYAVMSASIFFAVYTVSSSFSGAREIVSKFIEENLELLLSISMGHWFESVGQQVTDQRATSDSQKTGQRKERFKEKLREARHQVLSRQTFVQETLVRTTAVAIEAEDEKESKSKTLRESICTHILQKVSASSGNVFVFANGKPQGLEQETMLAVGTRLASLAEVEKNSQKVESLLHGFEVACLSDGVKYGPRFGNKVERHPENGSQFTIAIVAIPRYPPPSEVANDIKVALVFNSFDKDEDDWLNEVELTMWQLILKKPEFDVWEETVSFYFNTYGMKLNFEHGADKECLTTYYLAVPEALDKDYIHLFPQSHEVLAEAEEVIEEVSEMGSELDVLDFDEEMGAVTDEEAGGENTSAELEEHELSDYRLEQLKLEERLATNINTQRLQKIYHIVTQEQQEKRFDRSNFPDSFLAMKIVKTQFAFLSPVFGRTAILGGALGFTEGSDSMRRSAMESDPANGDLVTELLKSVALDAIQELVRLFHTHYSQMFEPLILQSGISDFFDNAITQRIQSKARHILNIRLDLSKADLFHTSLEFLEADPPKTAYQVWSLVRRYRLARDGEIREKLADAAVAGPLQTQIQVSLVVQVLVEVRVLNVEEIEKQFAETTTTGGAIREMTLWIPHRRECTQFLSQLIESRVGNQSTRLTTDDLAEVATHLIQNYLWLNAFLMLLQIMGFSLPHDEFPGETVFLGGTEGIMSVDYNLRRSVSGDSTEEASKREQGNLIRVKRVFDQLSNNTGFLPVDLADEAILLLTDNCLNYAGMVACLQHLNVGGVGKVGTESVNTILLELGFLPESVCYDIEPSSDMKEDKLDWAEYREGNWLTDELTRTFFRLTAASPGFMGKSQMIEFIREIEKSFKPNSIPSSYNTLRRNSVKPAQWGDEHLAPRTTTYHEEPLITFEMYHRSAVRLGFSCSRTHSRLMWILFSNDAYGGIRQFLPAAELANFTIRLFLQPIAQGGRGLSKEEGVEDATSFRGCLNFMMFKRLIKRLGITIVDKGIRNIWDDLPKDPVEIGYRDSSTGLMTTKFLRLEMDTLGFDPMKGRAVHVNILKRDLARFLCSGLWPEAIAVLFNLRLQLEISEARLESVLDTMSWRMNRYGLLRPEDVVTIMSEATVEGLTFGMLRELLLKMRLRLPEQDVKRMFDLMDVNHDHTLDLRELLAGFEMLFHRFVPNQIVDAVGLSYVQQLTVTAAVVGCLAALFCFIGFAFSAFVGLRSGVSAAVQSIIALVGAVGLQSGASESIERVQQKMKKRIAVIVGEDLDKRLSEQQEVEKTMSMQIAAEKKVVLERRPVELRYLLSTRYRPNLNDPKPCVTFHPGDEVFFSPQVAGGSEVQNLTWNIYPRMPTKTGLTFDFKKGIISGTIPQRDAPKISAIPIEMLLGNQLLVDTLGEKFQRQLTSSNSSGDGDFDELARQSLFITQPSGITSKRKKTKQVWMAKRTFVVSCRNAAGAARCRITFQIVPHPREQGTAGTRKPISA